MCLFLVIFVIISISANNVTYRLPTSVKPSLYSIRLHPNIDQGTFSGRVTIRVKVQSLTESIIFHASHLNITDVFLDQSRNLSVILKEKYELIEISRKNRQLISPGLHVIHVKYSGKFGRDFGLFLASTGDDFLLVSDFQPGNARMAFPCFDEPSFKARFSVELVAPNSSYTALSNMPQIDSYKTNKGIVYKFATSCDMSTYLVAFVITNYPYSELVFDYNDRKLPIRFFTTNASNEDENILKLLNYVKDTLIFFTDYTNVSYILPKLDFIEYDRNKSVATENWGLVTIRRGFLSPSLNLYHLFSIVPVLAHEIAHSWFGNLVTNNWWDDLWLQEGITVYISLKAEEYLLNNSAVATFSEEMLTVYELDQTASVGPVVDYVETLRDVQRHFSDIPYTKGAAVLQMIETVIGAVKFRDILQIYLKFFAFRTATTDDFITIVESFEPLIDMRSFIESFLYQKRFPFVQIEENNNSYILTQVSSYYKKNDSENQFGYKWTFPVIYKTDLKNQSETVWFNRDMEKLIIPKNGENWIVLNPNGIIIYYRVTYSESLWKKILKNLDGLGKSERNYLLHETVDLYTSQLIPCEFFLKLIEKLPLNKEGKIHNYVYIFLIDLYKEMYRYDRKSVHVVQGYFKVLFKRAGFPYKPLTVTDITKTFGVDLNKTGPVPERVVSCSKWIRTNLATFV